MNRLQKRTFVEDLSGVLKTQGLLVITRQTGLTVKESEDLRKNARSSGAVFKIVKNTLLKLALKDTTSVLDSHLTGPTGLAYSADPIAAAKVVVSYAKENKKVEVVAGVLEGSLLDANGVKALASLPPLDVLRAQIVGLLVAPAGRLLRTIKAPSEGLARVCQAYSEKK